ncbi:hypothetical protein GU926_07900 [Nibribacter ruber]|uniref:Uncharacterized protein n=1 Tax=Nibribacter ruber TaxID=2698458 RepID=A0A6P1NWC6_9BACT|nr:hypothetical protein [Nibribacter ruber]QHL87360.1 hypothetical protein GU926_07900 [Nibribacter ruber]
MGLFSNLMDSFFNKQNLKAKEGFKQDLIKNIQALIAYKGESNLSVQDFEKEVIYYACDILLHQKSQAGRFPSDEVMTSIIKNVTDAMKDLLPEYTEKHALFAQEGVRINLTQAPNMQEIIRVYYNTIFQR